MMTTTPTTETMSPSTPPAPAPAAPAATTGTRLAFVAGLVLQAGAGVLVLASGLMMPAWAIVVLAVIWAGGLGVQIRHRTRPLVVLAVPFVIATIWFLTGTLGETFLDWTA